MDDLVTQAREQLRRHGGRMTAQRRLILESFGELGGHPTADQLYEAAQAHDATLNRSTVYRTLDWLEQAGLVSARRLGAGRKATRRRRFDVAPAEHYHFVCTGCGRVIEFSTAQIDRLKDQFAREHGVKVAQASVSLYGLCAECGSGNRGSVERDFVDRSHRVEE